MKKNGISIIILGLVLCVSSGFSTPQEEEYYSYSFLRLNYVKGDVFLQRAGDMGYEEGSVNLPIVEGDKLGTRDGRAEIHFGRKNYLRVDNYTQVDFVELPQREDDFVSLHLLTGNIYLRINSMNGEKEFELHSPDGSFYVLEEGLYRFNVRDNQETSLFVVEGSIEAAGEQGSEMVRAGESLVVANGFFSTGPRYIYAGNDDAFSEWNRGRDIFHNRYVRTRYLPVDLYEYEAELDYYGRWVYERPYGYVWIPDVYQTTWKPYYHGRWIWYPVCGWTWCSYEPWGWCVSHYGRWHWRTGLGWYWIPTRTWGPAWVHWYSGVDYIGWCPLSYYNRPVVIVNNHFYGRNYDRYYPAHSRAFTAIRRDQLSARNMSKAALGRSGLSRLGKVSLSSRQPNVRPASRRIGDIDPAATKALSRTNIRPVSKNYTAGKSVRSSLQKELAQPSAIRSRSSRISGREGAAGQSGVGSVTNKTRTTTSARISPDSPSQLSKSRNSRSAIKAYPSRNGSSVRTYGKAEGDNQRSTAGLRAQISRSTSQNPSTRTGIKTYPSRRSSVRSSGTAASTRNSSSSNSSRRSLSTIKKYSSRTSPTTGSPSSRSSRSSYSSTIKRYSSATRTSTRVAPTRKPSPGTSSYRSTPNRSSYSSTIKRYSSLSRSNTRTAPARRSTSSTSSYRSSPGRSSYPVSRSRTSSRIGSSSSRSRSYSPSRVSAPRSSSSRSFKSTSRSGVSRSSASRSTGSRTSSRSSSSGRIKKK